MEDPNLWRDNPRDIAYAEGYRKGLEDGRKEIKYMTEPNKAVEDMLRRATRHMSEDKLDEITSRVCDIFRNTEFYDCTFCKEGDCIECEKPHTVYFLLDIIASLHNELYREIKGEYYDYMFHWANHGYGGHPDDGMFKEKEDEDGRSYLENMINSLRAVQAIECPCAGCKRTESDYCGLRECCDDFRKWKEAEYGIHSEGEA